LNRAISREIGESAYQYQKEIERKKRIVVGLNQFQIEEGPLKEILRIRPEVEQYQKEKLAKVKRERQQNSQGNSGRLEEGSSGQ